MNYKLDTLQTSFLNGSYIRTINYHNTPASKADWYEQQLRFYAHFFSSVTEDDLERFLTTRKWHKDKPGLIPAFYNGYRNNFDVMKPLLKYYGFVGWFFVPSDFVSTKPAQQATFAESHRLRLVPEEYADGRFALSWSEIRELAKDHVIASHTKTHSLISPDSPEAMQREIVMSQQDFEQKLGRKVRAFAWLSGSDYGKNPEIDGYLLEAEYEYLFSNFKIQKLG